jgi:hypothetical protein
MGCALEHGGHFRRYVSGCNTALCASTFTSCVWLQHGTLCIHIHIVCVAATRRFVHPHSHRVCGCNTALCASAFSACVAATRRFVHPHSLPVWLQHGALCIHILIVCMAATRRFVHPHSRHGTRRSDSRPHRRVTALRCLVPNLFGPICCALRDVPSNRPLMAREHLMAVPAVSQP